MIDQTRFLELYLANEKDVKSFIRTLVRNRQDFDDVCQSVALHLFKSSDSYDATRPFGPWARGVAVHQILAMQRSSQRRLVLLSPDLIAQLAEVFERRIHENSNGREELLQECLEQLPESSRTLLTLRYRDALSMDAISTQVGRTAAASQRALSRIRQRLSECIELRRKALREDRQ